MFAFCWTNIRKIFDICKSLIKNMKKIIKIQSPGKLARYGKIKSICDTSDKLGWVNIFFDWYCYCESNFVCIQSNIEGYYPKEEISEVDESEVRKVVTKYIR